MPITKTCNHKQMKNINTGAVLHALGKSGPMSRIGLTKALGLDGTTITHLVRDLLSSKLIEPTGFSAPATGRPKQMLQVNADGREAIGIELQPHRISGALTNLCGQVKVREQVDLTANETQQELLAKIQSVINKLIEKSVKSRLLGIGMACEGIMDRNTGVIVQAALLPGWNGVNVHEFFKSFTKLPYEAGNGTHAKAIAEHWFGAAKDIDNFLLLDMSVGIGCAIVAGRVPQCGITGSAGEIGHNVVIPDGKTCRCGMRGCLETVAAIPSIENAFCERFPQYGRTGFDQITVMATEGHRGAIEVIEEAGRYIGLAMSSLVNVLNPGHLVICGELLKAGEIVERAIRQSIEAHTIPSSFKSLHIIRGQIEKDAAAIGAATTLLSKVFAASI